MNGNSATLVYQLLYEAFAQLVFQRASFYWVESIKKTITEMNVTKL